MNRHTQIYKKPHLKCSWLTSKCMLLAADITERWHEDQGAHSCTMPEGMLQRDHPLITLILVHMHAVGGQAKGEME